jgi:hypothetical protein
MSKITWSKIHWHELSKNEYEIEIVQENKTNGTVEGKIFKNNKGKWEIKAYFPVPKVEQGIWGRAVADPALNKSYIDASEARKELIRMWEIYINSDTGKFEEDTDPQFSSPFYDPFGP